MIPVRFFRTIKLISRRRHNVKSIIFINKERKEIKDVLAKQNYAIKTLAEQVNNLQFVAETADNGMIYIVGRR